MSVISSLPIRIARKLILAIIGFILGVACTLLLYEFVISELGLKENKKRILFLGTGVFLSVGFAFSRQLRCISVLTIPEFTTRAGRRTIQATILILLISGPMENIGQNGEETVRFLGCIRNMLVDILIAGKDLILAPIQQIIEDIKNSGADTATAEKYNVSALKNMISPIVDEIEGHKEIDELKVQNDAVDKSMFEQGQTPRSAEIELEYSIKPDTPEFSAIETTYRKKLAYRCEDIFSQGTIQCEKLFKGKLQECEDHWSHIWGMSAALCWPMKLDFVCNILKFFDNEDKLCDLTDVIPSGFGETYFNAKKEIEDFSNGFKVNINYQGVAELVDLNSLKSARDELLDSYLNGKKYIEWYLTLIKRALAFSYLAVVYGALEYHWTYFSSLAVDNVYITKSFRRIDRKRDAQEKETLLPLKSFEKPYFSKLWRFWLTEKEMKRFGDLVIAIFIQAGVVFSVFGFDYVYAELLLLVQKHADMHIQQHGKHIFGIEVKGEGLLAQLLRIVVKDFLVGKEINIEHFTKPCLPIPKRTEKAYIERVIFLFLLLLLNAYLEAHFCRMRHKIANFFYPRRARKRVIWLYNETLRRRKQKENYLKQCCLENAEKFRRYVSRNPFVWLADTFPRTCRCLRWCKMGRRKCVVCTRNGEVWRCQRCGYSYCLECYRDLVEDQGCLHCFANDEIEDRERELMEDEEDEDEIV